MQTIETLYKTATVRKIDVVAASFNACPGNAVILSLERPRRVHDDIRAQG